MSRNVPSTSLVLDYFEVLYWFLEIHGPEVASSEKRGEN